MNKFRLILDPPRSATLNMGVDEMLMESQESHENFPTIRFYSWEQPAYSIGYFQNIKDIKKRFDLERAEIPVVRRITGGGLVPHGIDITFSITAKSDYPFFKGEVKDSYLKVNEAVRTGLQAILPKIDYANCKDIPPKRAGSDRICFEAPSCYDLLLNGKKITGSSQRRKNNSILHQSSVFLDVEKKEITARIIKGFKEKWEVDFFEEPLSDEELETCKKKEAERYNSEEWAFIPETSWAEHR